MSPLVSIAQSIPTPTPPTRCYAAAQKDPKALAEGFDSRPGVLVNNRPDVADIEWKEFCRLADDDLRLSLRDRVAKFKHDVRIVSSYVNDCESAEVNRFDDVLGDVGRAV